MYALRARRRLAGLAVGLACASLLFDTRPTRAKTQPSASSAPDPPPSTQPSGTRQRTTTRISFNLRDASLRSLLEQFSESTGMQILYDRNAPLDKPVSVMARQPRTADDVLQVIEIKLMENNYATVREGDILKIIPRDQAKKSNIPVHFGADPSRIPEIEELITQVIPVKTLDAVKLKTDLGPLTNADISANAASNSLMITDTSANIYRIAKIVNSLDQHQASSSELKVVRLQFTDAESAAKLVMSIFRPDQNQQQQNQGPFPFFPRFGPGGGGGPPGFGVPNGLGGQAGQSQAAGQEGKINAAADQRTQYRRHHRPARAGGRRRRHAARTRLRSGRIDGVLCVSREER